MGLRRCGYVPIMRAFALNCTLKPSPSVSSTDVMLDQIVAELKNHGVADHERIRMADVNVKAGVTADEGEGDEWPSIRRQILDAELFILASPIWMGHPSSFAQRALERLDSFLGDTDERGQMRTVDRVAMVAVVGNEDGAHHVGAELYQGLHDVGFTIGPSGMTYWVGEAMHHTDYKDLDHTPDKTAETTRSMVANAVHLARLIRDTPFPSLPH